MVAVAVYEKSLREVVEGSVVEHRKVRGGVCIVTQGDTWSWSESCGVVVLVGGRSVSWRRFVVGSVSVCVCLYRR